MRLLALSGFSHVRKIYKKVYKEHYMGELSQMSLTH